MDNRMEGAFDSIHAEEALKARTKAFVQSRRPVPQRRWIGKALGACACMLVLVMGGYTFYQMPVASISVDVNPSLELEINRLDTIVGVKDFNEDGRWLAEAVPLKNLHYTDGLEKLMKSQVMEDYLRRGELVSITVIGRTDEESEQMVSQISASAYGTQQNMACQCGSREQVDPAHAAGLSFGKYQAFLELNALEEITPEEVQTMTMKQIHDRIHALQGHGPEEALAHEAGRLESACHTPEVTEHTEAAEHAPEPVHPETPGSHDSHSSHQGKKEH